MATVADVGDVEAALQTLSENGSGPFVVRLPRASGSRDARYAHLLNGAVHIDPGAAESPEPAAPRSGLAERVERLESQVAILQRRLDEMRPSES